MVRAAWHGAVLEMAKLNIGSGIFQEMTQKNAYLIISASL